MSMMASPKQRTLTRKNMTIMSVMIITVMATSIIITANYILGFKHHFLKK
jgi:hypothetical protein